MEENGKLSKCQNETSFLIEAQQVEYVQKIAELQKDVLDLQVFKELVLTFGDAVFLFYLSNNNQSEVCEEDTGKEAPAKPTIATPSVTRGNQATILLHSGRQPYPRHIRPASSTQCSQTNILAVFRQPFLPFQANSFRNSHQRHNQHSRDQ